MNKFVRITHGWTGSAVVSSDLYELCGEAQIVSGRTEPIARIRQLDQSTSREIAVSFLQDVPLEEAKIFLKSVISERKEKLRNLELTLQAIDRGCYNQNKL